MKSPGDDVPINSRYHRANEVRHNSVTKKDTERRRSLDAQWEAETTPKKEIPINVQGAAAGESPTHAVGGEGRGIVSSRGSISCGEAAEAAATDCSHDTRSTATTHMRTALIVVFYLFGFVALVFEPLYYFGCHWEMANCATSGSTVVRRVGEIWQIYCAWDPMFLNLPLWLRVMCSVEVFLFGPLYVASAYGLQHQSAWLPCCALPFGGALVYSTIVYFVMVRESGVGMWRHFPSVRTKSVQC